MIKENHRKIMDDISKMWKSDLLKRYWIDQLDTNWYMQDYFLEKLYQLELYWYKSYFEKCFYEMDWKTLYQLVINGDRVLWWYEMKYNDEFIWFLQWILYSLKKLK